MSNDNQRAIIEAENAQFISVVSRVSAALKEEGIVKAELDKKKAVTREILAHAKTAGFHKYEIMDVIDDMLGDPRAVAERERRRVRWRGLYSQPVGTTTEELFGDERAPQEVRDEAYWRAKGYNVGLAAGEAKPPPECPERFVQAWLKGRGDGQAINIMGLNTPLAKPEAKTAAPINPQRAAEIAGYTVEQLENKSWVVTTPDSDDLAQEHLSPDAAWDAADLHLEETKQAAIKQENAPLDGFSETEEERLQREGAAG